MRVSGMRAAKRPGKGIGPLRHGQQMHVIAHQAVSRNRKMELVSVFTQQVEVKTMALKCVKDHLAAVSSLRDMVRNAFEHGSRNSRHSSAMVWVKRTNL